MTQSEAKGVVTTNRAAHSKVMVDCMAGLTASEHTMIRRLAGNDPDVRKKTVKKLRKWLSSIATRLPDSSLEECRTTIEPNFIRVWKALFYCMWFADKPIPQEQLAEQLSSLVAIFRKKPCALLLFIEWFFRTISREWSNIDRFRLDKFMMLIRRFFRSSLTQLYEEYHMRNEVLNPFLEIISTYVFNRFPTAVISKKTRAQLKVPDPLRAPLGFQMHFVDIYMEEVAKVCGSDLKYKKLLRMLKPFVHELAENDDERLTGEIKEKIFHYLMRQSDVALDFQEVREGKTQDDEEEEDQEVEEEMEGEDQDDKDLSEMVLDEPTNSAKSPLDPRAGAVDVILPQLDVDYEDLVRFLTQAGGRKEVRGKNRKLLYQLARSFEELTGGEYPLAVPIGKPTSSERRAIKKNVMKEATVRLLQLDQDLIDGKLSKSKKKKKNESSTVHVNNSIMQSSGIDSGESSAYIEDSELFDHVDDNYLSYLEEMHQADQANGSVSKTKKRKLKKKKARSADADSLTNSVSEAGSADLATTATNGVKKKAKKRKLQSREGEDGNTAMSPEIATKKQKDSSPSPVQEMQELEDSDPVSLSLKLRGKKNRRLSMTLASAERSPSPLSSPLTSPVKSNNMAIELGGDFVLSNGRMKTPLNKNILTPSSVPSSGLRKRVSFVMARNTEHPHDDYAQSIQRSPAIPYDSGRRPNSGGLLKSPATPNSHSKLKDFKIPLRKKATDYF